MYFQYNVLWLIIFSIPSLQLQAPLPRIPLLQLPCLQTQGEHW
jgi:hypothetical protein